MTNAYKKTLWNILIREHILVREHIPNCPGSCKRNTLMLQKEPTCPNQK